MSDPVWTELSFEVAAEAAELVASAVSELTGGVEVRDAGTLLKAGAGRALIVTQCLPEAADEVVEAALETCARAEDAGLAVAPVEVKRREAHEDEWRDVWKKYFRATRVGRTFIVRPSWDPGDVADGDRVIDLDPGRAFGTGGHATTRLVITLAEEVETREVRRFLDLGCGSGILSVAAARLWPRAAGLAVDVDVEATDCTRENFERNGVTTVETLTGMLSDIPNAARAFDVVLANIQADVLLPLARELVATLAPRATLVLSGLLTVDAGPVLDAYLAAGLTLEARREEDEWTALRLAAP
ncbi:MAG TPA: 50S ribosomal protein L11 methyltransferase [Polyangia bacterium]|nr:50S ribosomal protein L11 methyltransferase [Polyangia bacterium]